MNSGRRSSEPLFSARPVVIDANADENGQNRTKDHDFEKHISSGPTGYQLDAPGQYNFG